MARIDEPDEEAVERQKVDQLWRRAARNKFDKHARRVVKAIKKYPEEARLSGDDSGLKNFWEEFKYQVQRQESVHFEQYESNVRELCRSTAQALSRDEQTLLWLVSEAFIDRPDEADVSPPFGDILDEALENELYNRVWAIADTEELAYDPDDAQALEEFEDDQRMQS